MPLFDNRQPEHLSDDVKELVARQRATWFGSPNERKREATKRLSILNERHADLVAQRIAETHHDPTIRARIKKFISIAINPGRDITNALACVYKQGVRREIRGSKRKTEALVDLNEESKMSVVAPMINQLSWFVGPTLEIPVIRNGKLRRDIITTESLDVSLDPDDPLGAPIMAAWPWMYKGEPAIVVMDQGEKAIWGMRGDKPLFQEEHGLKDGEGNPIFPGTLWRFDTPIDIGDFWGIHRNSRLVDATVECSFIYSMMNWVRKTQNRQQIAYFGNLEHLQKTSKLDPEAAIISHVSDDDPPPVFDVKDLNTPPANFIQHIMFIYKTMIESYGVPQSTLTFDFSGPATSPETTQPAASLLLAHEKLSQLRNGLIPYAREAEMLTQVRAIAAAHAANHPLAKKLPTVKDVEDRFSVEWPEINRVDSPALLQQVLDWELHRGMTTDVKILQMRRPDLTEEEAKAELMDNLDTQAEINTIKAERNLDPAQELLDVNEATGAQGPETRDAPKKAVAHIRPSRGRGPGKPDPSKPEPPKDKAK